MKAARTVTISLPPDLARQIDRLAKQQGRTRSELLREAFRRYAERLDRWDRIFSYGRALADSKGLEEQDLSRMARQARKEIARNRRRST